LNLAIAFVFVLYPSWFATQKAVLRSAYFFACFFVIAIFLCSSKLGLMSLLLNILFIFFYRIRSRLSAKGSFLIIVILVALSVLFYFIFPAPFQRLVSLMNFDAEHVDKNAIESTAVRVLIWEQSMELIKQNFFFGTGVGDANAELYKAYERNGLTGAYSYKLNAHNQFLQTFIGMGIFSFAVLLFLTIGAMIRALLTRQFLLFIFAFLISFNFLVESMLQRAAGVVFFCFFYCFLTLVKEDDFMLDEKAVL
jgi:O-antigen ligase